MSGASKTCSNFTSSSRPAARYVRFEFTIGDIEQSFLDLRILNSQSSCLLAKPDAVQEAAEHIQRAQALLVLLPRIFSAVSLNRCFCYSFHQLYVPLFYWCDISACRIGD